MDSNHYYNELKPDAPEGSFYNQQNTLISVKVRNSIKGKLEALKYGNFDSEIEIKEINRMREM